MVNCLKHLTIDTCKDVFCIPPESFFIAKILKICDGDTVICGIISPVTNKPVSLKVRINNIDTPELHPKEYKNKSTEKNLLEIQAAECSLRFLAFLVGVPLSNTLERKEEINKYLKDSKKYTKLFVLHVTESVCSGEGKGTSFDNFGRVIGDFVTLDEFFPMPYQDMKCVSEILLKEGYARDSRKLKVFSKTPWETSELEKIISKFCSSINMK